MPRRKRKPRPHPNPPRDLAKRELPLHMSQEPWLRIHRLGLEAIFFGTGGDNRFDAPGGEFGVLYVAQDMFGAFVETLGHKTGTRLIALTDLQARGLAQIHVARPLKLVDLTGSGLFHRQSQAPWSLCKSFFASGLPLAAIEISTSLLSTGGGLPTVGQVMGQGHAECATRSRRCCCVALLCNDDTCRPVGGILPGPASWATAGSEALGTT